MSAERRRSRRLFKIRAFLGWLTIGDRRCNKCGTITVRLRKPMMLDSGQEYDRCGARYGNTWTGTQQIPECWNEKGHDGPHFDEVLVRWDDPLVLDFAAPGVSVVAPLGDKEDGS